MDDDGLIPEALRAAIEPCRAAGRRVKLLYTIPNFHNPAGVTLSDDAARRDRWRSAGEPASPSSRTTRTACWVSTGHLPARCARTTRTT